MRFIVFAGNIHEYLHFLEQMDWQPNDATYMHKVEQVRGIMNVAYFEVGHYTDNDAWHKFREQYGYNVKEREAMLKDIEPYKGARLVSYYRSEVMHICKEGVQAYLKHHDIFPLPTGIRMMPIIDYRGVTIGTRGVCGKCGQEYVSVKHPVDKINEVFGQGTIDVICGQIATEFPISTNAVVDLYHQLHSYDKVYDALTTYVALGRSINIDDFHPILRT